MKRAALHNLGCKVNAYETQAMQQLLEQAGYEIVAFHEKADVYVVNTCSVTNIADRKSRQMLHRARRLNPHAVIVAAGCYVQAKDPDVLEDGIADIILGNNKKEHLIVMLEEYQRYHTPVTDMEDINAGKQSYERLFISRTTEHTRAFIKIQDGCNQFCSYCVIPYARGRVRSRLPSDILKEVQSLAQSGCKEVVLTGIHLSSYGTDFEEKEVYESGLPTDDGDAKDLYSGRRPGFYLLQLISQIHKVAGICRIRLGSLEPGIITREFVRTLAGMEKICPHFHLSLQSGCDTVLKRMNRKYCSKQYEQKCQILREYFSNPAITTDVIAGFPQETEEEFLQTKRFLEQIHFYEMHIFKYSKREGTKAAVMNGQIPEPVKTARSAQLIALGEQMSAQYREQFIGAEKSVLLEEDFVYDGRRYETGYTKEYLKIAVASDKKRSNCVVRGKITGHLVQDIYLMVEF